MITEEMEDILIERILQRQIKANEKILKEIAEILAEIGDINPSEAYKIGQMLKYGESLERIIKVLADNSQLTELEIYEMLEKEAKMNLGFQKKYFKAKKIDFIPYEKNIALQNKVQEIAIATIGTYRNISRTTGIAYLDKYGNRVVKPIREAYNEIVDKAIYDVSMGKETFYEALKRQLSIIGQNGIQSIEYESGYHRRIDSSLRMNLSDGLNSLSMAQQEIVGEQFGANMIEVSHHENAAPDHIDTVDGKQFVILGAIIDQIEKGVEKEIKMSDIDVANMRVKYKGKWYYDFEAFNETLQRKVGTCNCYHTIFTGILGLDEPRYTEEELKKDKEKNEKGFEYEGKHYTLYEGEQLLRRIELELRKNKETEIMAKYGGSKELLDKCIKKERALLNKYYDVTKASGLNTKLERIRLLTAKTTD